VERGEKQNGGIILTSCEGRPGWPAKRFASPAMAGGMIRYLLAATSMDDFTFLRLQGCAMLPNSREK
jgi:hypothetical protein